MQNVSNPLTVGLSGGGSTIILQLVNTPADPLPVTGGPGIGRALVMGGLVAVTAAVALVW